MFSRPFLSEPFDSPTSPVSSESKNPLSALLSVFSYSVSSPRFLLVNFSSCDFITSLSSSISFCIFASSSSARSLCLTAFASLNVRVHTCCVFKLFTSVEFFFSCSNCSFRVFNSAFNSAVTCCNSSTSVGTPFLFELRLTSSVFFSGL